MVLAALPGRAAGWRSIKNGPITNPYNNGLNAPGTTDAPGYPNPSLTPETFHDTPLVNGTAYPVMNVTQKAYRFRVLNGANDRMFNLSLFYAVDPGPDGVVGTADDIPCNGTGAPTSCAEVRLVPSMPHAKKLPATTLDGLLDCSAVGVIPVISPVSGLPTNCWPSKWPTDGRDGGVPDPTLAGPSITQIGTEGGFLPAPVTILAQPVNYIYDRRNIVVLNVGDHSMFLGPAERSDILIDFTSVPAGSKVILYNDSPAPVPAFDPRLDYYTDDLENSAVGGSPTTLVGYGPNTRTIMRFDVAAGAGPGINAGLAAAISSAFATDQDPILVPEPEYNVAYGGTAFPRVYVPIQNTSVSFTPLAWTGFPAPTPLLNFPMQPKAIQELFELNYGRMNATLGVELPFTNGNNQTTIPMGYPEIPTEILNDSIVDGPVRLGDSTQIWKITHNGVDTHAVHVHLFNAQIINRVGWDGAVRLPGPEELGWKETIKMNPLEDIIIALRPVAPQLPFGVPVSVRNYDVTQPASALINTFDPRDGSAVTVPNDPAVAAVSANNPNLPGLNTILPANFGWEYVWHCHILGHEENDMMRPMVFNVVTAVPASPIGLAVDATGLLTWTDPTPVGANPLIPANLGNPQNEIGFRVEHSTDGTNFTVAGYALANAVFYQDTVTLGGDNYWRVYAYNASGDSAVAAVQILVPPVAPTNLGATVLSASSIRLNWTLSATPVPPVTGQQVYENGVPVGGVLGPNVTTLTRTGLLAGGTVYSYYVVAIKGTVVSPPSNVVSTTTTPVIASLTANQTFPFQANGTTAITWTATASGGGQPLQYRFSRFNQTTGTTTTVQALGASNTYSWTPTGFDAGFYTIGVYVRDSNGNWASLFTAVFQIIDTPIVISSLAANQAFPFTADGVTAITWTALASGGTAPLQYRFVRWSQASGTTTTVQNYSTSNTYSWTPTSANAGNYQIGVYVRDADRRHGLVVHAAVHHCQQRARDHLADAQSDVPVHGERHDVNHLDRDGNRRRRAAPVPLRPLVAGDWRYHNRAGAGREQHVYLDTASRQRWVLPGRRLCPGQRRDLEVPVHDDLPDSVVEGVDVH